MKDSEVVHDDISPGTKFPVVKGVNHHEAGWVGTQFGVIRILKRVSQDKKTVGGNASPSSEVMIPSLGFPILHRHSYPNQR